MRRVFSRVVSLAVAFVMATAGAVVFAQDFFRRQRSTTAMYDNVEYDGRLTFVRLRYSGGFRRDPGWLHDYPTADIHMMKILSELSITPARTDGSNILALDDPELFHYPIAYMSEPGFWVPSDEDVTSLRNYLLKGGFIIFDDFRGARDWTNLQQRMEEVLPKARWVPLDATHPIFHSFFDINTLIRQGYYGEAAFLGIFEDNDPQKRLVAIANYNHDLGELWEFSDTGWVPVDLSNEAYKYGVNYVIYAMTH
jgi:hypothetical protein